MLLRLSNYKMGFQIILNRMSNIISCNITNHIPINKLLLKGDKSIHNSVLKRGTTSLMDTLFVTTATRGRQSMTITNTGTILDRVIKTPNVMFCTKMTNYHQYHFAFRPLSTTATPPPLTPTHEPRAVDGTVIAIGPDGTKYAIPPQPLGKFRQKRHAAKLAPSIKNARIRKLRVAEGKLRNIRHSPWRLNLICQFVSKQTSTVPEALMQLKFVEKVKAPVVAALIHGVADNARVKYGLQPSQLEVAECFATHGSHLKRIQIMGRGRAGKKLRRFSHIRLVLREIDFPLKIIMARTKGERSKWIERMNIARKDYEESLSEKEELERLEREVQEMQREQEEKAKEAKKS